MQTLTVTTPFGTFSRRTATPYSHVAILGKPDGSPMNLVGAAGIATRRKGTPLPQYTAKWSRSEQGARNAKDGYNIAAVVLGVFPITAEPTDAAPAAPAATEATPEPQETASSGETAQTAQVGFHLIPLAAASVLDTADSRLVLASHLSKDDLHLLRRDKAGRPRTACGVPMTRNSSWLFRGYGQASDLTCRTCCQAAAKQTIQACSTHGSNLKATCTECFAAGRHNLKAAGLSPNRTGGPPEAQETASSQEHGQEAIRLDIGARAFNELWVVEHDTAQMDQDDEHTALARAMAEASKLPNGKWRHLVTPDVLVYLAENLHYHVDRLQDMMSSVSQRYDPQAWSNLGADLAAIRGLDQRVRRMCQERGLRHRVWTSNGMAYRDQAQST